MSERPVIPDSHVVRRVGSDKTHVATVMRLDNAILFGVMYWTPWNEETAACGVKIPNGSVIMRPGTVTRCRTCVHLTGVTEEPSR